MGVFFTSPRPIAPAIQNALESALTEDPRTLAAPIKTEAAARAHTLAQETTPQFNLRNFVGALIISAILLWIAIAIDESPKEISKVLMTSFTSFSGIVLGLLGGEAQKSAS